MGSHEGWSQPDSFYPNGLLPDEAASVTRMLDEERWSIAEERIAELIAHIQPNQPSEDRRNAVADYVQQLIAKYFSCQVFTFGSVPLKTYLPDGDIDLTAFSKNQNLKDTWASDVRDMLENEEKSENAEFHVKEVQYIQAEVKIIKCLVENIVVDISFNQIGGLCTLCFLEEVDSLINQNHLFKRSVILIKAWCYYESRILGAHHGLISTYALETLVLYIFHVFNNDFTGPLEVLYRFLEFFSKFDWENFCVSLWGPVPISSLPDVIADPPRKDGGELLLSKVFLRACSTVYSVFPGGQENNELPFISKHFNVIDPLRTNNNLGRSVSKGNFFRIRGAFAFGAQRLARLLDCPKKNINAEVDRFFLNTWDRHGKGRRPDALNSDPYGLRCLNVNHVNGFDNLRNSSSSKKVKEKPTGHESKIEENRGSHAANGVLSQQGNQLLKRNSRTTNNVAGPQSQKKFASLTCSLASDQNHQMPPGYDSNHNVHIDKGRNCRPDYLGNKMNSRYHIARTHSSPELTEYSENSNQGRHKRASESINEQAAITRLDYSMRNLGLEASSHVEYRRYLQKLGESWGNTNSESDYGISETEGSSLLGDEEPLGEIKNSCLEWCCQHNIEYVEVCASNADFDKCLSVDGDSQGVDRLYGALSAHMWPGMILKSGNNIIEPSLSEKQELSEEESDYEFEYEILSAGSAEPWDDTYGGWVSSNHNTTSVSTEGQVDQNLDTKNSEVERDSRSSVGGELQPSTSASELQKEIDKEEMSIARESDKTSELDEGTAYEFEDLEKLMFEIGTMRDSLRLMPDFQRREMAAKLATKMASMFGDGSGDEE